MRLPNSRTVISTTGTILLVTLCGTLSYAGIRLLLDDVSIPPIVVPSRPPILIDGPARGEPPRPVAPNDPAVARPMFFATRVPFQPPPTPPLANTITALPPAPVPAPTMQVDSILILASTQRAHLHRPQEADGPWITPGSVVDGWTVTDISPDAVLLALAGQRVLIRLYENDGQFRFVNARPTTAH